ncbi:MAG: hypothetical protein ABSH56_13435 [Bryobacteraceae bacterium]|jgi:hypothetical protein
MGSLGTLRNHKKEAATVRVVERLYRWTNGVITQESPTHRQVDSRTVEYEVTLQPDEERTWATRLTTTGERRLAQFLHLAASRLWLSLPQGARLHEVKLLSQPNSLRVGSLQSLRQGVIDQSRRPSGSWTFRIGARPP